MFDIKLIREEPEIFDTALKRRKLEPQSSTLIEADNRQSQCSSSSTAVIKPKIDKVPHNRPTHSHNSQNQIVIMEKKRKS